MSSINMTNITKSLLVFGVVAGAFGLAAFFGFSPFARTIVQQIAGSAAGSTFNTAKFAGVVVALTNQGANGTSTSILNTDASTRYVTGVRLGCTGLGNSFTVGTGAGLVALKLTVGTSTASAPADLVSVGQFSRIASQMTVATASPTFVLSSTTPITSTSTIATWQSGEYMTFYWNATSTATSTCTEGVDYIGA